MSKPLRPYQIKGRTAIADNLQQGVSRQLCVMATGTGKTKLGVDTIDFLNLKKTLWVSHTEELCHQSAMAFIRTKFDESFANHVEQIGFLNYISNKPNFAGNEFKMGCIKADIFEPNGSIVMASAQTLYRRLDKLKIDEFDCVVTDEAHLFLSRTFSEPLKYFQPKLLLGLTATPHRLDGLSMGDIYDKIVFEYNIQDGIKDGYLCELEGVRIRTNISLDDVKTTAGDLNQKELAESVNCFKRNKLIVDSYLKYAKGRQGIFFCVDIQHCLDLLELFLEAGISAVAVSSDEEKTGNRAEGMKGYKSGKYDVLINVNIATTGFDHPNTGVIGHGCPTKSLTKWMQATGRGSRLKDEEYVSKFGQNCILLDFVDNTSKHSLINAWNLDSGLPTEDKVYMTRREKERLINARNAKIEAKHNKDERVQLLPILTPKWKTNIKSSGVALDSSQLGFLQGLGYDTVNENFTLENLREITGSLPATREQMLELKKFNFTLDQPITRSQASYSLWCYQNNKINPRR